MSEVTPLWAANEVPQKLPAIQMSGRSYRGVGIAPRGRECDILTPCPSPGSS